MRTLPVRTLLSALRKEFPPMLRLATPVVVAELGWMAMGIVDIAMVGRLGPEAIGAVGVGSVLFFAFVVFGIGMLLGLDPLIAQAFGQGRIEECQRWLMHGVGLAVLLAVPLTLVTGFILAMLDRWGLDPAVERLAGPYFARIQWSILPLLLYAAFRRYLQAVGHAPYVMVALVTANVINVVANWALVFGNLGAPALGVNGAAWATCVSRIYLAVFLAAVIMRQARLDTFRVSLRLERRRLVRLLRLGLPAATQVTLEVGVFAVVTALAGRFDTGTLAAHQIVLNVASVTFMVPLGIGSAGAVRVGHAVGRRDPPGVRRAGWTALLLGAGFMSGAAIVFVSVPEAILGLFTGDPTVIRVGVSLLLVAALFQLCDGLQGVATGVLRGLGDTRTPLMCNLGGHWLVGLPLGSVLCFVGGWSVFGLWVGLSVGLTLVGIVLATTWWRRSRHWLG